ncbi:MAG: hypothetical protein HYX42_05830 [Polaromonas sp.]|uniref:hypothetical protein n=1 Tax=Polaromonas sp. TaxID=1869339 RepID=UPI0025EF71F3|nr:hypothetical protein [Polaromonas sp.]MBI2725754.1 hypothetical protein [Polaromonas sp.]
MNAPLPEHIRKALEMVMLDEKSRSGFYQRYKYSGGAADCVFGVEHVKTKAAA